MNEGLKSIEIYTGGSYLVESTTNFNVVDEQWIPVNFMGTTTRTLNQNVTLVCEDTQGYPQANQGRCSVFGAKGWKQNHFAVIEKKHLENGYISPMSR